MVGWDDALRRPIRLRRAIPGHRALQSIRRDAPRPPSGHRPRTARRGREHQAPGTLDPGDPPWPPGLLPVHRMVGSVGRAEPGPTRDAGRPGAHGLGRGPRSVRRSRAPGRGSCPCATGRRPVGRIPRSGRVELRLGPAWVRYRGSATPETDPPSAVHRPVLVAGRHRARLSRPRVTLPRCRPCSWWPPAAMPTAPMPPARLRLRPPDLRSCAAAIPTRPGACSAALPCAPHGPAVLHRVAE
jgi:hypothetical protein